MGSAALHLRATMREAAGRLLGQLHDRNTRAHFLAPEAFYISSLPPALFRREAAAAAASPGGLFEDSRSRVGVVLRYAFVLPRMVCSSAAAQWGFAPQKPQRPSIACHVEQPAAAAYSPFLEASRCTLTPTHAGRPVLIRSNLVSLTPLPI